MSDWGTLDLRTLRTMHKNGATPEQIHEAITTHSPRAVRKKGYALGLSWRLAGSRRGLVIGQPRNVSLVSDDKTSTLRDLMIAGKVKSCVVVARLALAARGAEICPMCSRRPVTVERTGLCVVCHKGVLIEIQTEQLAAIEAHKIQQVVWQQKSRLKKRELEK